jgi:hypothetical protein
MEHTDAAHVAALVGALGAVLALIPRDRFSPLAGLALLGIASAALDRSLVGDEDVERLFTEPAGLAVLGSGAVVAVALAFPLVRWPALVPLVLLTAAPFRVPVTVGSEEAFLLLPFYLLLSSCVLALAWRVLRGARPASPPFLLALPLAAFVVFTASSFLWTWDEREGGIELAFFVFPFVAAFAVVARTPLVEWLPRALLGTLVGLGVVFASVGLWQSQTRTVFFARDIEVANAYTTFFRVTSLFKDPSLYGRYLVVPIAVLLVVIVLRQGRSREWIAAASLVAFLFWGLFYSYSQSSFVALFAVAFGVALLGAGRRLRVVLLACATVAVLAAAGYAAQAVEDRSAREVTSGRSRLVTVTLDAFEAAPLVGVGVGGQPRASAEESGRGSPGRNASHTTPLTVLAEGGLVGFALYLWVLGAAGWALLLVARRDRVLGIGLAAVLLTLFVHALLYAGFFEDALTWGALGIAAAVLAAPPSPSAVRAEAAARAPGAPRVLAH